MTPFQFPRRSTSKAWLSIYQTVDGDGNTTEPVPVAWSEDPRFVDDALTPDSGSGTAPLVDIGACEFVRPQFVVQPCYPNCDGSTTIPLLNVNDFICFQTRFAAGEEYADCDHSGSLNVLDFVCFQGAFAAGCR